MRNSMAIKALAGICIVVILVVSIGVFKVNVKDRDTKPLKASSLVNNKDVYKIITDTRFITLHNDGGSHVNVYYIVDFNNNMIAKYEDKYVGFEGYKYKDKLVSEKGIEETEATKFKKILEELIVKDDINNTNNYNFYTIENGDDKNNIHNEESIELLKDIIDIL